jgi:hypothetical protein
MEPLWRNGTGIERPFSVSFRQPCVTRYGFLE